MASQSASIPRFFQSLTAVRQWRSRSSRAEGTCPDRAQRRDGLAGPDERVEEPDDGVLGRAGRAQPHGDLGDETEGALGADEQRHEVVPGDALGGLAADADELARAGDDLEGEDVVAGDAVLDAAHPAGVRRDVAADRRPRRARRVRRVPEAVLGAGGPQVVVDDPRLDHREALDGVDAQHGRHPLEADDDATGDGVGAARTARCPRPAGRPAPRAGRTSGRWCAPGRRRSVGRPPGAGPTPPTRPRRGCSAPSRPGSVSSVPAGSRSARLAMSGTATAVAGAPAIVGRAATVIARP